MNSVVLSFLKANKVSYYLIEGNKVVFPCLFCGNGLVMGVTDYSWSCSNCDQIGNIITLDKQLNRKKTSHNAFFNPKTTHKELLRLTNKIADYNLRVEIEKKVKELYQHIRKSSG